MRVVTYNVHRFVGRDGRQDLARIQEVLHPLDADIIALQEATWGGDKATIRLLAHALNMKPLYGLTMEEGVGAYGNVLMVRPDMLREHACLPMLYKRKEPRCAITASVRFEGHDIRLVATHLGLRGAERRTQIGILLKHLREDDNPIQLLFGDLNLWKPSSIADRMLQRYFDIIAKAKSFPSGRPLLALDRVCIKGAKIRDIHVPVKDARVASDHRPVVVDLILPSQD